MSLEYKMDVDYNLESEVLNLGDSVGYDLYLQIREEALRDGHAEGRETGRIETAKNMLKENIDIEIISKCSGLPLEQVKELAVNMK